MEEWKEYRLGDICDTISDTYKGNSPQVVLINTSDVLEGKCLNHIPVPNKNLKGQFKKTFCNEDILYSEIRPANKRFAYIDFEPKDYIASTKLMVIRSKEEVLPKYLYYILQSNQMLDKLQTLAETRSGTFPQITFSELAAQKIILPGLNSQKKIVQVLESINSKIELNRRINENLEQQAQALFKSWFVDFEPFKDGKFVDSELGMIPEEWRVGYYTELVDIKGGGTPKTNIKEYWNGDIPFFSPKDVDSNCFVLDTEKHITAMGLDNCNSNLFPSKTVFITARGTVGKIVMAGTEMAMNQTNYALLGKHNVSQYYVYLITLQLVTRLLKKANGAVFNAITTRDFTNERIVIPFNSIIKSFSSIVEPLYENILLNEFQIKRLSQLRDTLLPRLMSGELAITDVDDRSIFQ